MYGPIAKRNGNAWGPWEPLSEWEVQLARLNPFGDKRVSLPNGVTERTKRGDDARRIAYLAKHGYDYPVLAAPMEAGSTAEPLLIDGLHRLAAAKLRGDKVVPVRWADRVKGDYLEEDAEVAALHEEMQRRLRGGLLSRGRQT